MSQIYLWTLAGLLFASELLMLAVLGGSVWVLLGRGAVALAAGVAAVVAACVLWALFASPEPVYDVVAAKFAAKVGLYCIAAILLARNGIRAEWWWAFVGFSLLTNIAALAPPYRNFGG